MGLCFVGYEFNPTISRQNHFWFILAQQLLFVLIKKPAVAGFLKTLQNQIKDFGC